MNGEQRRAAILEYLAEHFQANGYAPTIAQIGEAVGYRGKSGVMHHLDELEAQGRITRTPNTPRSIRLVERPL